MKPLFLLALLLLAAQPALAQRTHQTLQVPGRDAFCRIDTAGVSVLPSGRYVTPVGQATRITSDPFGLALSPDGRRAVTLHDGVLTVLELTRNVVTTDVAATDVAATDVVKSATRIPDYAGTIASPVAGGSFLGVAFAPDNRTVYLSHGDTGNVVIFDVVSRQKTGEISLNGGGYADSFTSDLRLRGNELLVLDRANFRLVRIDLGTRQITQSIRVGRQPFGLSLSPDGRLAFVANVGLYEYPLVPGVTPTNKDTLMLRFPPYGAHSPESREGVVIGGRKIPGLGDPLAPEAMSVWIIDLATNHVVSRIKTGMQIGDRTGARMIEEAEVIGGASPNSVAVGRRFAYVSNATNDNISIIDHARRSSVGTIPLRIDPTLDGHRGLMPFGLALSRDERTLYVALLAFNAVAVVDVVNRRVRGLIPTGWGPTRVALSPDRTGGPERTLYVVSARGYGAGPNGGRGFVKPPQGTYIGDIQLGLFQAIPLPSAPQLATQTRRVLANTYQTVPVVDSGRNPLPPLPRVRPSPIKHIVYITKENRTYDEVLGQLKTGGGTPARGTPTRGDSTLARFGTNVTIRTRTATRRAADGRATDQPGDSIRITNADVMPNHARIAQQWAFSDNFYCDSDASIHGHHWMMGTIPNEWVEAQSATTATFQPFSKAPGRRFPRTTGAIDPEDYNEIGGLWEALERSGVSFYNFGQANEYAGAYEEWNTLPFGTAQPVAFPMPNAVFKRTSRQYAGYNTSIPDQYRVAQFEREFTERWLSVGGRPPKEKLPQLLTVMIPNDHGADARPDFGYPLLHSYMADNDLATGRMLQFLSKTPYWKDMLVIITEDDPQGGVDHVDAHRSLLLMAGPYVRRGYVSHTHANFGSILKVIYNVLGVPYVNQYDQTASLLQDFFTDQPDLTPYRAVLPDARVFDPKRALQPYGQPFDWEAVRRAPRQGVPELDDPREQRIEHYRQQQEK